MAAPLDPLDAQVESVGCTGVVMDEDLSPPGREGVAKRADLLDIIASAADDGFVEKVAATLGLSSVR